MRINNKRIRPIFRVLYGIAIIKLVLGLFLYFVPIGTITDKIPAHYFFILAILQFLCMRFLGNQQFEYDSDGEALNFKSQDAFLASYSQSFMKSSDFPKKKLISFK